jgi:hypothetical protein
MVTSWLSEISSLNGTQERNQLKAQYKYVKLIKPRDFKTYGGVEV